MRRRRRRKREKDELRARCGVVINEHGRVASMMLFLHV